MQTNKVKSSVAAGLLGLFLGQFGAHSWYLGKKTQGIIHVSLLAGSIVLMIAALAVAMSSATSFYYYATVSPAFPGLSFFLMALAWLLTVGNGIWAFVEAVIILVRGDAGLAAQGYTVATPVVLAPATPQNPSTPQSPAAQNPAAPQGSAPTSVAPQTVAPQVQATPKQPMNPATKKKIILGCSIGAGALVALMVACIVIAVVTHVDYGETYRQAKSLREDIGELYSSYDCERVVTNAGYDWVSDNTYNKYIEACKSLTAGLDDKIAELEQTSGVRKDSDLSAAFEKFKKEYTAAVPSTDELAASLELYKTWHSYIVAIDGLSTSSTDSALRSAANILIDSGNATLKTYGETWLEKTTDYIHAYRDYQNASYSDSNYQELRDTYRTKQTEQRDWVAENQPDLSELAPLNLTNTSKIYNTYRDFYNLVVDAYEENYDSDSGDCTELRTGVYCS